MSLRALSFSLGFAVVLSACTLATGEDAATTPAASEALTTGAPASHPIARVVFAGYQASAVAMNDSWLLLDGWATGDTFVASDYTAWNDVNHAQSSIDEVQYLGPTVTLLKLGTSLHFAGPYPTLSKVDALIDGVTITCADAVASTLDAGAVTRPTETDYVLSGGYVRPVAGNGGACFVGNTVVGLEGKSGTAAQRIDDVSTLESSIVVTIALPPRCAAGTRLCVDHCVLNSRPCD